MTYISSRSIFASIFIHACLVFCVIIPSFVLSNIMPNRRYGATKISAKVMTLSLDQYESLINRKSGFSTGGKKLLELNDVKEVARQPVQAFVTETSNQKSVASSVSPLLEQIGKGNDAKSSGKLTDVKQSIKPSNVNIEGKLVVKKKHFVVSKIAMLPVKAPRSLVSSVSSSPIPVARAINSSTKRASVDPKKVSVKQPVNHVIHNTTQDKVTVQNISNEDTLNKKDDSATADSSNSPNVELSDMPIGVVLSSGKSDNTGIASFFDTSEDIISAGDPNTVSVSDLISIQIMHCWHEYRTTNENAKGLSPTIEVLFARDGSVIELRPIYFSFSDAKKQALFNKMLKNATSAVHACTPLRNLPENRYEEWEIVKFNFHY